MKHNRILVVDKEPAFRKRLAGILEDKGFKTASAGSIREGRELAQGFRPHLIVAGVMLPDGDGCDLYTELRGRVPELPVLFLCSDDLETARLRGLGFTAERWIPRASAQEELVGRAERIIERTYERVSDGEASAV